MFKIAIICGGPSFERGISLNSARSVMDHLTSSTISVIPIYVDYQKNFYLISPSQLYSNTPADFDFKLDRTAKSLDTLALQAVLKSADIIFPVIHGPFGEDGTLQSLLEEWNIPYIGSDSQSCKLMFSKYRASQALSKAGYETLPSALLIKGEDENNERKIRDFFTVHQLVRAVVKPVCGGSSIGVFSLTTAEEAIEKARFIFTSGMDTEAILEPFCKGKEFTVVVFQNKEQEAVALVPTEIEMSYDNNQIFDYRRKYLPTENTAYHTPARFHPTIIDSIRTQAEAIFTHFGMRDFARLDGWLTEDQTLYFTDFNPLSGLEQNSFPFRQAAILGMTHQECLFYILQQACNRLKISCPLPHTVPSEDKQPVYVPFGGKNAERQVSLMSGTNVWLKLLQSTLYYPIPFFYDPNGMLWQLPYSYALNHTTEEVYNDCQQALLTSQTIQSLTSLIHPRLGLSPAIDCQPQHFTLDAFLQKASEEKAFVFIAMHGGEGENGTLQKALETYDIPYNGSNASVSELCMDKYRTGLAIQSLNNLNIHSIPKKELRISEIKSYSSSQFKQFWLDTTRALLTSCCIIKPRYDGCSAGIVLLTSETDLERYCHFAVQGARLIPPYSFANQEGWIEMPSSASDDYIIEPYIETDSILIQKNTLSHISKEGWIELTVGVMEKNGIYHALNPSITLAEGAVLSLEEKFQGGTGVNITPPSEEILPACMTHTIKKAIEKTAETLGIENYARIDIFFNRLTEKIVIIEANTLPGLTASTVIYHQALSETPPLTPLSFLEKLISSKLEQIRLVGKKDL